MTRFPVLRYARYLGHGSQSVYGYESFCGACRQHLPSPSDFPKEPEALEGEDWYGIGQRDRKLSYVSFCPWCGVEFEDEWWRNQPIQNERVVDHYQNPGTHRGDTHEFRGSGPDCMAGHWLAVSGGDKVCWCEPEIIPGLMGCVIRHQDKRHDDYIAELQRVETDARERRDQYEQVSGNHAAHDPQHCSYCEDNAYDGDSCEKCNGDGILVGGDTCEECDGHGFRGYSW